MEEIESLLAKATGREVSSADKLAAFGDIVRRFQDMAYGCAYAVLGDFHLAEDAAQDAFVTAYRELPQLREPKAFAGWLRRIVITQCSRMTRRKRVRTTRLDGAHTVASGELLPPQALEKRELKDAVLSAIRALPDNQRIVTTLFYINGYSQEDIAEFLEVPVTTVKKRLVTSRNRLKQRMMSMVDETLKSFPLPERFADVVVQMNVVTERINPLAERMRSLSDQQMLDTSATLRRRLATGESRDALLVEAFALVREATRRAHNQPHYDVQLVAGMILDQGWIAEEATGEGKSIACYPGAYMAVLEGKHVHVVTVNDYLVRRDAALAEAVFSRLGVTVGGVTSDMATAGQGADARRRAYQCDITYGTMCELGFDHLRDTLRPPADPPVQGPLDVAIIDEADTVLLDEARTPLVISDAIPVDAEGYREADTVARELIARQASGTPLYDTAPGSGRDVRLTHAGVQATQEIGSGAELESDRVRRVEQALRAHLLCHKDKQYVVRHGEVLILDPATGRSTPGRIWSDGLHQAIETKEGVTLTPASRVKATITVRDYFGRYQKLAGLTGTAKKQSALFRDGYGLDVAAVPTRRPVNRVDHPDRVYADPDAKYDAIVEEIRHYSQDLGRPVLVGTTSIEQSERLSAMLTGRHGIEHERLDARPDSAAREAPVVDRMGQQQARADGSSGVAGAVTIATAMAGRGTDVRLGPGAVRPECHVPSAEKLAELGLEVDPDFPPGSCKCCIDCTDYDQATQCERCFKPKIARGFPRRGRTACRKEPPCGLHVIGAERQPVRRLDDQLRARAGRQGAPGSSRFFLSLRDGLLVGAADDLTDCADLLHPRACPIEDPRLTDAIARAQQRSEQHLFETHRHVQTCIRRES